MRIVNPEESGKTEMDAPDNVLYCGALQYLSKYVTRNFRSLAFSLTHMRTQRHIINEPFVILLCWHLQGSEDQELSGISFNGKLKAAFQSAFGIVCPD